MLVACCQHDLFIDLSIIICLFSRKASTVFRKWRISVGSLQTSSSGKENIYRLVSLLLDTHCSHVELFVTRCFQLMSQSASVGSSSGSQMDFLGELKRAMWNANASSNA